MQSSNQQQGYYNNPPPPANGNILHPSPHLDMYSTSQDPQQQSRHQQQLPPQHHQQQQQQQHTPAPPQHPQAQQQHPQAQQSWGGMQQPQPPRMQQFYQQPQLPPPGHMLPLPLPSTGQQPMNMYGQPPSHLSTPVPPMQQDRPPIQMSYSGTTEKYRYTLEVIQQPQRARMCGFGDKDRRPITPPPCIRLDLTYLDGRPVDIESIDGSFFVLQVDLWSDTADREVNIVRASNSTPTTSISTATTTSFPPTMERPELGQHMMYYSSGGPMMNMAGQDRMGYPAQYPSGLPIGYGMQPIHPYASNQTSSTMFTRNLIGSLTVNASKLNDTENKASYWFVLQDLSVRTEGWFRLKMNFIDVGTGVGLNRGKAPVLAWVFSDAFQVFSAKKFPGVIESTPLSKSFASQGIKIPIRKDTKAEGGGDDDDEG